MAAALVRILPAVAIASAGLLVSPPRATAGPAYAVGLRVLHLVDRSRTITLPGGRTEPRPLVTYVRYPATGKTSSRDQTDAPPAGSGPYPLIVFGHGFAVTPATYAYLLRRWTQVGYVVAAPVFPLGNADAPGGPNENDLVNQPPDISFVISRMIAASETRGSPFYRLIDPTRIAVAGHSDGGDTALAAAYDSHFRDPRIKAAAILSGAEIPGLGGYGFRPGAPPLLACQGTRDRLNPPFLTAQFYDVASRPKFLLTLPGAPHLAPYTWEEPQRTIIAAVTIAFFDHYLRGGPLPRLKSTFGGSARLSSDP